MAGDGGVKAALPIAATVDVEAVRTKRVREARAPARARLRSAGRARLSRDGALAWILVTGVPRDASKARRRAQGKRR